MNADQGGYFDPLSERVIGAIFEVADTLGAGFLEKCMNGLGSEIGYARGSGCLLIMSLSA
jgi:hypothetical protein